MVTFLVSCNSVKRIPENEALLKENSIYVNSKKADSLLKYVYQKPNKTLAGLPLRLYVYNMAKPNIDSVLRQNINNTPKRKKRLTKLLSAKQLGKYVKNRENFNTWLKETGEAPTILRDTLTKKSNEQLQKYFFNNGWFDVKSTYKITKTKRQKAKVSYQVVSGNRYHLDSITKRIATPKIDSILSLGEHKSYITRGKPYIADNFTKERERITRKLRNSGVYNFSQDYVSFDIDTIGTRGKVNVDLLIKNKIVRTEDTIIAEPFKVFKVKTVNIYANNFFENQNNAVTDSVYHNGYNLYSVGKLRYNPKALTNAVFITPNAVFKDINRTRTYRSISGLKVFKYPSINYVENPDTTLTANIYLTPLKRFSLGFSAEASQSNIQSLGIALNPSVLIRNVFKGAETFEVSGRGSIAASKDLANERDQFFDINELGGNLKLTIPRLFSPFNTDKIIPKYMFPTTRLSMAATGQTNVGLDKQTFTGALNYRWYPNKKVTNRLDFFNLQYVRNLNISRYFEIYQSSFNSLNDVARNLDVIQQNETLSGYTAANAFIYDVLETNKYKGIISVQDYLAVNSVKERKDRLTENNLILSSNFNYVINNKEDVLDKSFSIFRAKLELAGNTFSLMSQLLGQEKKGSATNKRYELFNVAYSQFVKTELDYIRNWKTGSKNVIAMRAFLGIAIPYGNSSNIPFSKSFFAGGANDNRAWAAYSLGPGRSLIANEFHEANMKLALSIENRFNIFGSLNGAIFVDAGNIWNVLDDIDIPGAKFEGITSLQDIAIGSGVGLRYDFDFFVLRFDVGFKTLDPTREEKKRWFKEYNFSRATYNIGINYPF